LPVPEQPQFPLQRRVCQTDFGELCPNRFQWPRIPIRITIVSILKGHSELVPAIVPQRQWSGQSESRSDCIRSAAPSSCFSAWFSDAGDSTRSEHALVTEPHGQLARIAAAAAPDGSIDRGATQAAVGLMPRLQGARRPARFSRKGGGSAGVRQWCGCPVGQRRWRGRRSRRGGP